MRLFLALMSAIAVANADGLDCNGCVHTDDIRGQAVTTQKIRREAVVEGKLSPEVQRKLNGLVLTDGVGRRLPIELGEITANYARGYYRLESGAVIPVSIERRIVGQPHQIYGASLSYEVIGATTQPTSTVFFTGAGCTGFSYVAQFYAVTDRLLFPHILMADSAAPNRSRLVFRIGDRIDQPLLPLSHMHDVYGCTEADPDSPYPHLPYGTANDISRIDLGSPIGIPDPVFFEANLEGAFRWVPPLTISAP